MKVMRNSMYRDRRGERGVTMVLIALAMVSLLAMAASCARGVILKRYWRTGPRG